MYAFFRLSAAAAGLMLLSACGGGGGGSAPPAPAPVTPPTPPVSGWVSGVYQAASTFKDKCLRPRSGADIEGNAFTDRAGTIVDEKNWLRSWTRETYLWNTEVVDRNPSLPGTPVAYFEFMKTLASTASGRYKDEFHFSEPTADYLARRNSSASASFGANIIVEAASVPRSIRVVFTDDNTPASAVTGGVQALKRGTRILSVEGIDVVYGITSDAELDTVNRALFAPTAGQSYNFVVQDEGGSARSVTLKAASLTPRAVNRTTVVESDKGKVGYIVFNTFSPFSSEREIAEAMQVVSDAGVSELVLDLRYNGGGLLAVSSQVSYMIAGEARSKDKIFEKRRFNALAGDRNPATGQINTPIPFFSKGLGFSLAEGTLLPSLNLKRVYVLTGENTCSASEAVINGLRGIDVEVILIGEATCGKPYGFFPQDNCGTTYYTVQFEGQNHKGFSDYTDGFIAQNSSRSYGVRLPGCEAADDLTYELGDKREGLLGAALSYINTGSCPAHTQGSTERQAVRGSSASTSTLIFGPPTREVKNPKQSLMFNRDMTMPGGH